MFKPRMLRRIQCISGLTGILALALLPLFRAAAEALLRLVAVAIGMWIGGLDLEM